MDTLYYDAAADNDGDNNDDIENRAIHENSDILDNGVVFYCIPMEHITYGTLIYVNINDILILATMMMNTLLGVYCLRKPWE